MTPTVKTAWTTTTTTNSTKLSGPAGRTASALDDLKALTSPTVPEISEAEVAELFARWNGTLQSGDPVVVTANYAPGSVLLPTLSDVMRVTRAEKVDYFRGFLAKQPFGVIDHRRIQIVGQTAVDCGHYTFYFGADGTTAQARYSYSYGWFGPESGWLITSHHSSLMPVAGQ